MPLSEISHYRILEKLGAGGMGEVYLAEDMKLGRKVAIKILSDEYTTNKDRLHRFEQEAAAASNLNHPNILTIHEVGSHDGHHFIATEYIDGVTLRRKAAEAPLEIKEILDIAIQIAGALEEAHAAGIVHRDIKPDNVMVRRNGYVKVLDFGLAKLAETIDRSPLDPDAATRVLVQTDAGVVMGTSHYMSPEQARGKPVDARSDIWSLGVVIYELIAGRTPFSGETSTDVIVAITQKEPPPLARFAPSVPAELEWIVNKALRKDRDERYQTIKELLTDLRRLKQRLEFETELERSSSPGIVTKSTVSTVATPTIQDRAITTAEKRVTHVSSAEYIVSEIKRHKIAAVLITLALVAIIGAGYYYYYQRAQPLMTERDTVLLTDFINTTGEAVFDGTLKQALAVHLGQSPFLNLFPEERVRETLRFMGRSPDDRITRDVGREICQRQAIKAMLIGTIASIGSHYSITLEAIDPRSGNSFAREHVEAESKEKVLASLGTAASNLRQKLGESLSSIQKYDVKIEQATTSSLEALKAYAMGDEERTKGRARESLVFYKRAVELDPNFAMAHARISVYYFNQKQVETAKQYIQKAYDLRDRVSERERLYIAEKYYNYLTGELEKAIETLQTWTRLYPNDFVPHNNLSLSYKLLGRHEDALKEALEAVRLSPNNTTARTNVINDFLALGRFDEAEQALEELRKINSEQFIVHGATFFLASVHGDQATMDREVEWARGKPEEADFTAIRSAHAMYLGKAKGSEELARRAVELFMQQERYENGASVMLNLAGNLAVLGKCQQAKDYVKVAIDLFEGEFAVAEAALIHAVCNDSSRAENMIEAARKAAPKNSLLASIGTPVVRAQVARNRGNAAEAIRLLESVRSYDLGEATGVTNNYARGQLYLEQRRGNEAATEFRKIIESRGIDAYSPIHAVAHLGLARAAVINGDTAAARKAYQDFFALWKDADADVPILVQARKEYEQLK